MIIKEAVLRSLQDLRKTSTYMDVYNHIKNQDYYDFGKSKTPAQTISASLGDFIRNGDARVKRAKSNKGTFFYYLTEFEDEINVEEFQAHEVDPKSNSAQIATYHERDLHVLLSSYLKNENNCTKTIFHEKSTTNDSHQKWIHPDMVGVDFLVLKNKVSQIFLKVINQVDTFKITSYEIKKEINTDYELKKSFFQAVSNSSWANYGYLVAFEISSSLYEEMKRLNQSFGIGIIELNSNPFESRVLYPSKYKDLDFKTIDKLCKINKDFETFIEHVEKLLAAEERYIKGAKNELESFCDNYLTSDIEIEKYCIEKNIPLEKN